MVDHSLDKWHGKPSNIKLGGGGFSDRDNNTQ